MWQTRSMAVHPMEVDFVAYNQQGDPLLLVEVKGGRKETSETWAARFRRNLLAHGTLPRAPYFLIATPDRMYFWRQDDASSKEKRPDFSTDARTELTSYFEAANWGPSTIGGHALELILLTWLTEIAEFGAARIKEPSLAKWLSESGLLSALHGARIELTTVQ